jgi:hypothetical protein
VLLLILMDIHCLGCETSENNINVGEWTQISNTTAFKSER